MSPATPVLEDAHPDDAEETPEEEEKAAVAAKSLDDIIDAYARANPEESTAPER